MRIGKFLVLVISLFLILQPVSAEQDNNFKILSVDISITADIVDIDILVNASWINYVVEDNNTIILEQDVWQGWAPIGIHIFFYQSKSLGTHNCSVTIHDLKNGVPYDNVIVLNFSYTVLGVGEVVNEPVDRFVFEPITFDPIPPTPSFPYMVCGYIILGLLLSLFTVAILNYRTPLHKSEKTTHDIRVDVIKSGEYVLVDSDKEDMKSDFDDIRFTYGDNPYDVVFDFDSDGKLETGTWGSHSQKEDNVEELLTTRCRYCGTPNTKPVTRCKYCGGSF